MDHSQATTKLNNFEYSQYYLINCLFAKNVMIPNKIVYKPRWEYVSFLSRALVHHGYALVNYLSSRQE
jgi:hypothetical protein